MQAGALAKFYAERTIEVRDVSKSAIQRNVGNPVNPGALLFQPHGCLPQACPEYILVRCGTGKIFKATRKKAAVERFDQRIGNLEGAVYDAMHTQTRQLALKSILGDDG